MRCRQCLSTLLLLVIGLTAARPAVGESAKTWLGHEAALEAALKTGEVFSEEEIGMGVTEPWRVTLRFGTESLQAVWKPLSPGRRGGYWESYQAEVAAYELDKLLELGMVPPTVVRQISGQRGSLQLWVEDAQLYRDIQGKEPSTSHWSREASKMKFFDNLIHNPDRNAQNFMVDADWNIILIDHSRGFTSNKKLLPEDHQRPAQFGRSLVEKLRKLDAEELDAAFKGLLMKGQRKALRARQEALLDYLDALLAEHGEDQVLF